VIDVESYRGTRKMGMETDVAGLLRDVKEIP